MDYLLVNRQNYKTVYIFGAGLNQSIKTYERRILISPPLSNNLFQIAHKLGDRFVDYQSSRLVELYQFIFKYWHKSLFDLELAGFNLEECFTLIQLQLIDAELASDYTTARELILVQRQLIAFFSEVLSEFREYYKLSSNMLSLGRILYNEKPTIITFNYDDFLESVIEEASGLSNAWPPPLKFQSQYSRRDIPTLVTSSQWNWNRPLGYGIKFDRVLLHDGSRGNYQKFFNKRIFYKYNTLYSWNILKLHGSLNWWKYLNQSPNVFWTDDMIQHAYKRKKKQISLQNLVCDLLVSDTPFDLEQLFVEPIIITPVLYKQFRNDDFIYNKVFEPLWKSAHRELSLCKNLIIIGYSFPSNDFHVKRLLLEALSNNIINELTIINPDPEVIERITDLIRYKKLYLYKNLESYIQNKLFSYIIICSQLSLLPCHITLFGYRSRISDQISDLLKF